MKTFAKLRGDRAVLISFILILANFWPLLAGPRIKVSYSSSLSPQPLTGRLILILARKDSPEPRLTISPYGPPIFGLDVENWPAGVPAIVDKKTLGYPVENIEELPNGEYFLQAILNVYTQCQRADGHTIWVHLDRSFGSPFYNSPGNFYTEVKKIFFDPRRDDVFHLELTRVIPEFKLPQETEWLRRVWIKSEILSKFWRQSIYFGATVLLPKGYNDHPETRYPVVYVFEHGVPFSFNPDPKSHEQALVRARDAGLETGYEFYQSWISDKFPRFIAVTFHQPTPYFPSSYSVNSANCGPYGDALLQELIPYLEKNFRMIAKPHARLLEGASTGGWEALALQLYYPDFFGGAWVFNPDPIDFRRYQLVNIYEDENAFYLPINEWRQVERPMRRTTEGQVIDTVKSMSHFELVLGTKGRSGYQFNGWEAVFGPTDEEGYPGALWDKKTGKINRDVANYMKEKGYDLREYLSRNWTNLGPKLEGKLNFFAGEMDNFYLNLAVYLFEDFLRQTVKPHYPGRFTYGRAKKGHNWHLSTWADLIKEMAEHVKQHTPRGEDISWWNY